MLKTGILNSYCEKASIKLTFEALLTEFLQGFYVFSKNPRHKTACTVLGLF